MPDTLIYHPQMRILIEHNSLTGMLHERLSAIFYGNSERKSVKRMTLLLRVLLSFVILFR